jgi:polar amino acid transport system substrate-binding protein
MIKIVAYAPERGSALEAIKIAVDHGVVAAVGHTDASYDQTHAGISAGAQTSTPLVSWAWGEENLHRRLGGRRGARLHHNAGRRHDRRDLDWAGLVRRARNAAYCVRLGAMPEFEKFHPAKEIRVITARLKRVRQVIVAAAVLSTMVLAACAPTQTPSSSSSPASGGSPGQISLVTPGKLTVCTHLSYKPFEFKDNSNKVVGFDVDLMDLVAKKLGVTLEIFDVDFASQTSGAVFAARKCDAAMGAVTITDKRKEAVAFSDPYFKATQALLVKKDSGINDLSQLRGKKLGVQTDTTGQIYAEDNKAANGYEIVVFDDGPTTLTGVLSGRVAAAINDNGTVYDFAKDNPTTTVSKEFNTGEQYGFMVQKDNANAAALLAVINDVIKTSKSDGSYDAIYKKWFGVQPA